MFCNDCRTWLLTMLQVRLQMEALLAEKAKLAQENARLLRENNGLQVGSTAQAVSSAQCPAGPAKPLLSTCDQSRT